jgi:hypothetical protein
MLFLPFWLRFGTKSGSPLPMATPRMFFPEVSFAALLLRHIDQMQWRSSYCPDIALSTPISIALVSLSNPPARVATHLNVSLIFCLTAQISPSCFVLHRLDKLPGLPSHQASLVTSRWGHSPSHLSFFLVGNPAVFFWLYSFRFVSFLSIRPMPPPLFHTSCHIGRTLGTSNRALVSVTSYTGGRWLAAGKFHQAGQVLIKWRHNVPPSRPALEMAIGPVSPRFLLFYKLVYITLFSK